MDDGVVVIGIIDIILLISLSTALFFFVYLWFILHTNVLFSYFVV